VLSWSASVEIVATWTFRLLVEIRFQFGEIELLDRRGRRIQRPGFVRREGMIFSVVHVGGKRPHEPSFSANLLGLVSSPGQ